MSSHLESSAPPVTRDLAAFAVKAVHEGITERTRREAVRTFVNWLGCAIGGARHPAVDIALDALAPFAGPAEFTVPGREGKADLFGAALAMGISSHVFDFDDTHLKTIIHPAGPVASALLPLAERDRLSGRRLSRGADRRHRGGVPPRQRRLPGPLRRRLAHHRHDRRLRRGGRRLPGARPRRRPGDLRARHRGDPVERLPRDVRLHVQELPRRRRREERPPRGPPGAARLHELDPRRSRRRAASPT